MNPLSIFRYCAISKKKHEKSQLVRLIRLPNGTIEFDIAMEKKGRSLYCFQSEKIMKIFFHEKKRKMIEHFLHCSIPQNQWEKLCKEALNSLSSS